MRILLTNDDGVNARGIRVLQERLKKDNHEVFVIAPESERSAFSHSITINRPVYLNEHEENVWSISGTPVDCVFFLKDVIKIENIDLVISGINGGQNMGRDVLYSGTVGVALEAMLHGYKAIAISMNEYRDQKYETGAEVMAQLLRQNIHEYCKEGQILNINIPNITFEEIKGIKLTSLGHRYYKNYIRTDKDENGRTFYLIGGDMPEWDNSENSDFKAISENYVSITPVWPNFEVLDVPESLKLGIKVLNL